MANPATLIAFGFSALDLEELEALYWSLVIAEERSLAVLGELAENSQPCDVAYDRVRTIGRMRSVAESMLVQKRKQSAGA